MTTPDPACLITTPNGVLDIRDLTLRPHEGDDPQGPIPMTRVSYDPTAKSERWDEFLKWAMDGNDDLIGFLQRAAGVSLTEYSGNVLYVCYGPGPKYTFLDALLHVAGTYRAEAPLDEIFEHGLHRWADLRMACAYVERDGASRLPEAWIKMVTDGSAVTAQAPYGLPFTFVPKCTMWIDAQSWPRVQGNDMAVRRRIVPIHWPAAPGRRAPSSRQLHSEASGIFRWVVEGAHAWHRDGLQIPEKVRVTA